MLQGDSGGPLLYDNATYGITSFTTSDGCEVGAPAVFTRVSSYKDWIIKHTGIEP